MSNLELIPFGKYKGQPIEAVKADAQYFEWLKNQDWFRDKYSNMYNIIINNFTEPTDTPEHNSMQAKFLNKEYIEKIIKLHWNKLLGSVFEYRKSKFINNTFTISDIKFEIGGWDVFFDLSFLGNKLFVPEISYGKQIIFENKPGTITIKRYDNNINYIEKPTLKQAEQNEFLFLRLGIELKPSIGDDYPSILRQIRARKDINFLRKMLFYKEYTGVGVSEDEFRAIIKASSIIVIKESEIL